MKLWGQQSMVQGTVEAVWALGLGGRRLYISTFCLPVISPGRSRAVLTSPLCSALSSPASFIWSPLRPDGSRGLIISIPVNKTRPEGRLGHVTIHMVLAVDLASANSCSQTKCPGTGQEDSTCLGPLPGRISDKVVSGLCRITVHSLL